VIFIAKGYFKSFNKYKINGDITILYLEKKDGRIFECLIDTEDLDSLKRLGYCWNAAYDKKIDGFYVKASVYQGNGKSNLTFYLHKLLMNNGDGLKFVVHHKNKNTLDNRKENLEIVPYIKNVQLRDGANKNCGTGVRNVHLCKCYDGSYEYRVQIMKDYQPYRWTFSYNQFNEACEFARHKRIELFGEE
jgi:hypothetical protein